MSHCMCDTTEQHPASECIPPWKTPTDVQQDDLRALLVALGLGDHARSYSAHAVIHRDILPALAARPSADTETALREALDALLAEAETFMADDSPQFARLISRIQDARAALDGER